MENYSTKDYNRHPQNWGIVQDGRGIIYVANGNGVLEYDGTDWRSIPIPNKSVLSLAIDDAGTGPLYIGGNGEIGFLSADSIGMLKYVSLCDRLKEDHKNFSIVWKTYKTKEGVYFQSPEFLFRWDEKQKEIKVLEKNVNAFFICGGELYIRQEGEGLQEMVDGSFKLTPEGEKFAKIAIFMMVPYDTYQSDSKKLLIGTKENGLYSFNGTKIETFKTEMSGYLKENELYHGIRLSSGDFAIATLYGGLVIIDANGRLKSIIDEEYGLQDNSVRHVFEDTEGNLWLGLDSGISKIEYKSPFSIFDKRAKLAGTVLSVIWQEPHGSHRTLYVGTTRGLYSLSSPFKTFQSVQKIYGYCWSLLSIDNSLLAATSKGVFQVTHKGKRNVIPDESYVLHRALRDNKRIWVGTGNKLVSLYSENGQWKKEREFRKIKDQIRTIVEDRGNLWLGTLTKGVLKVDFPGDGKNMNYEVTRYDTSYNLPAEWNFSFKAVGHVMFATKKGIYRYDKDTDTFLPDFTLGEDFAGSLKENSVFHIVEDNNKNIWFHSERRNYRAVLQKDGTFELKRKPFLRIPPAQVNIIYPEPDGDTIWFGNSDGLIRYDKTGEKDYGLDFNTYIRKVVANGKLIFAGYKYTTASDPKCLIPPIENLSFEFAAPFFKNESATEYQYRLDGHDDNWSDWSSNTKKQYFDLDSGLYTFRVRGKNVYGEQGSVAAFQFKILLPWYREWWAFLLYIFVFSLLIYLIAKLRHSIRLKLEKQKLERIVKERTREIEDKSQQLEKQTLQLKEQSEKLKEVDKVKSRFFANISHEFRTPLTLIMGPLEQMLSATPDKEQQKTLNLMLRNSQRLLSLINQLLELSKFDSGKMRFQACQQNIVPFLKGIVASFESIAGKNELGLTFYAEKENITLYFDPEKLEEIIFNLLANAVKFTPAGGMITVMVNTTETRPREEDFPAGSLDISVGDTGPGIPRDQLAHIFDRFYQSDSTYEHHQKGSGIGLAIAKELVELHQGRIDAHSREGKGTEFIIRLPMGKAHLKPEEIVEISPPPSPRKTPAEIPILYMSGKDEEVPEPGTVDSENRDTAQTGRDIVLVVEDSADVREYIKRSLETHYHVVEARGGQEGIQKAREIIPDLIISDVMMPETDGYELCRVLKNNIDTSHIPVVLLTAKASEENIIQGLETGADDYITKPFNTRILCARIKNLIDLRRHMQESLKREMTLQPAKISVTQIDKTFLNKLKEVINQNISDPEFNIDQLCKELDMSQPTLYRKIHALTGESPTEFIRSYRLKRGADLLKENPGSVLEVAFEVGFSSASYFTKCFKKKFHQLPSTFKESEGEV